MNTKARKTRIILIIALALLGGIALATVTWAMPRNAPLDQGLDQALVQGGAPTVVAYQGEVQVGGTPHTGNGYFKFAVVNAAGTTTYWSNDGTSTGGGEPTATVQLAVSDGLFGVLLGDTSLAGMTRALTADVFSQPDRTLRVWFSSDNVTFDQLTPDTRIAAVPYALQAQEAADADTVDGYEGTALEESAEIDADIAAHAAIPGAHHARYTDGEAWAATVANDGSGSGLDADTVDGLHASQLGTHYQNVIVVAKSGGDYTGVQAAINSITDAAAGNPYLVWVSPGVYSETVTMKPHVHLQGAGQEATVISSTASSSGDWPPAQATLALASDASLRDLTVSNSGTGDRNTALLATAGVTRTLVADVTARALGGGVSNYAIFLSGSGTDVTLQQVTALAENGSGSNYGLINFNGATAVLRGGSFTSRGGEKARGIFNTGVTTTLKADNVTVLAENASNANFGLYNWGGPTAVLYGGSFTGRGGTTTRGIENANNGAKLTAESVIALAENGSDYNIGFGSYDSVTTTLRGGSFIARGGADAYGISNGANGATLEAESVTALAEDGSGNNYGLWSFDNAQTTVRGGSFTGRGGIYAYGIHNTDDDTTLEAESVSALGENGSSTNFGLSNTASAEATLRGGSFTGRGGIYAYGIHNTDDNTTLEAEGVTALGEDGSSYNYGLYNFDSAEATLHGGSFTGRGGESASGVLNTLSSTLTAEGITALAENSSTYNYGLSNSGGVTATLRGGSFIGRGGAHTWGIRNAAALEAESVSALGKDGSSSNYGLYNFTGASAILRGGSFTGSGGTYARGIFNYNAGSGATLEAKSVSALGENGSISNDGLYNDGSATANVTQSVLEGATNSILRFGGTVTVSNSRLAGNAVSGTVTCVLVTRGTTISTDGSTCP